MYKLIITIGRRCRQPCYGYFKELNVNLSAQKALEAAFTTGGGGVSSVKAALVISNNLLQ